jgi:hypothetical protein
MSRAVYGRWNPFAAVLELIALTLVCGDAAGVAAPAHCLSAAWAADSWTRVNAIRACTPNTSYIEFVI